MKLGIFAKTFAGTDPLTVLGAAAAAGYKSVQYNMACSGIGSLPDAVSDEVARGVAEASRKTGVEIAAISATYNMIHPDLQKRETGRLSFAAIAARSHEIGSRLLTVCTGSRDAEDQWRHHPDNQTDAAWNEMIEEFRHLLTIAETYDIDIGVEPEFANVVDSADKAALLIKTLASPRIRVVLDPANLVEVADPDERRRVIEASVKELGPHIALAHAKDRNADGSFATAGKGVVDFDHYIECLKEVDFSGSLITHGLGADEASWVSEFLFDVLARKAAE